MPIEGDLKEIPAQVFDKYYLSSFIINSTLGFGSSVLIEVKPYRLDENGNEVFALVPPILLQIPNLFADKDITQDLEVGSAVIQTQAAIFDAVGKVLKKKGLI